MASDGKKFFESLLKGNEQLKSPTPNNDKNAKNNDRLSLGSDTGESVVSEASSVDLLSMNNSSISINASVASPKRVGGKETLEEKIARVMGQIKGGSKPRIEKPDPYVDK